VQPNIRSFTYKDPIFETQRLCVSIIYLHQVHAISATKFCHELAPVSRANRFPDFPTLNTTHFAKEGPSPHTSSLVKDKLLEFALTLVHKMWAK